MSERYDAVVLGGGVAGLAAAGELAAAGLDVVLLEARSRLGGRVFTLRTAGDPPVELGAEFVHGAGRRTATLARDAGIAIVEPRPSQWWFRRGALEQDPELDRATDAAFAVTEKMDLGGVDRSFVQVLDEARVPEPGRSLALEFVEGFQAADPARISACALAGGEGNERTRRIPSGYDRVVEALAGQVPPGAIHRETVARAVRWSRGSVEVTALAGGREPVFRAACAVVALPVACLGLGDVRFEPGLGRIAGKGKALAGVETGHVVRLVLRFREAFWCERLPPPFFVRLLESVVPVVWSGPTAASRDLVAWVGGPRAWALEDRARQHADDSGPPGLAGRVLDVLGQALAIDRRHLDDLLTSARAHDWTRDPFSRGAYSYPLVGGASAWRALTEPADGTLFFAGEATSQPPANGTVEGALESGHRAARQVIASR